MARKPRRQKAKTAQRSAQLVLGNPDLVATILGFCDPDGTPYDYRESHPLKDMAVVNRLFREVSTRLIFARVRFETYSRYSPEMSPDESLEKTFAYYQSCATYISFPSIASLCLNLPFLLHTSHSQLRYLDVNFHFHGVDEPIIHVDMRDRIIYLMTQAELDRQMQVQIQSVDTNRELGVERWPKDFQIIRYVHLSLYDFAKLDPDTDFEVRKQIVKSVSLQSIMSPSISNNHSSPASEPRCDEERIFGAHFTMYTDMLQVERFLWYPYLEYLDLSGHAFIIQDLLTIIRQANVRTLVIERLYPSIRWSAAEMYRILQGFIASTINRLDLTIAMSIDSFFDLNNFAIPGYKEVQSMNLKAFARLSNNYSRSKKLLYQNQPSVTVLHDTFYGWTWLGNSPRHLRERHILLSIELSPVDDDEDSPADDDEDDL